MLKVEREGLVLLRMKLSRVAPCICPMVGQM